MAARSGLPVAGRPAEGVPLRSRSSMNALVWVSLAATHQGRGVPKAAELLPQGTGQTRGRTQRLLSSEGRPVEDGYD